MVMMLHAFLVSDGQLKQEVLVLLECHSGARIARSFSGPGKIPGKMALLTSATVVDHPTGVGQLLHG